MKNIYLLPICMLLAVTVGAQTTKTFTQTKLDVNKKYDKIEKVNPLHFHLKHTSLGLSLGSTGYLGELQTKKAVLAYNKLGGGLFLHNYLNSNIAVRLMLNYGAVSANDANSSSSDIQKRNLNFRTNIIELGLVGEYHFVFHKKQLTAKGVNSKACKLSPYVFGGVALFHFNPQAEYKGQWIDLKPLHTEGQTLPGSKAKDYKLTQISLPIGLGINYAVSERVAIGLETGMRKTFTDYIDDVSTSYPDQAALAATQGTQAAKLSWRGDEVVGRESKKVSAGTKRGSSENKDYYFISAVTLKYKLKK